MTGVITWKQLPVRHWSASGEAARISVLRPFWKGHYFILCTFVRYLCHPKGSQLIFIGPGPLHMAGALPKSFLLQNYHVIGRKDLFRAK